MSQNTRYPNVVFIMPDQFRRQAMGFWSREKYRGAINGTSDPVHTPNLDRFADESIVFSQAISTQPVCSPFRAMLMSGRFPEQNGVKVNCKAGRDSSLREDIECFTDVLAKAGYSLGYIFEGDGSIQRRGVRTYRYTMVIEIDRAFKSRKLMLYDNIEDPYQMDNLSAEELDKKTLDALAWELGYWLNILNL